MCIYVDMFICTNACAYHTRRSMHMRARSMFGRARTEAKRSGEQMRARATVWPAACEGDDDKCIYACACTLFGTACSAHVRIHFNPLFLVADVFDEVVIFSLSKKDKGQIRLIIKIPKKPENKNYDVPTLRIPMW